MAMQDNDQDPDWDNIRSTTDSDTLLDPEVTMQCMQATMGYHVTLHKIISRKFIHANNAVKQRISELESEDDVEKAKSNVVRLDKYRNLLIHLKQLTVVLEEAQLEIDDLEHMDGVFHMLPGRIKHYYEHMISLDQELQELIAEVSSAEYQAAYKRAQKIIDMVQDGKNILSGRSVRDEYADISIKGVLHPIKNELRNMGSRRDVIVSPDGKIIKDL